MGASGKGQQAPTPGRTAGKAARSSRALALASVALEASAVALAGKGADVMRAKAARASITGVLQAQEWGVGL